MTKADAIADLMDKVTALEAKVAQVDRQSRCRHVWEPDEKTKSGRRCGQCGCEPLGRA